MGYSGLLRLIKSLGRKPVIRTAAQYESGARWQMYSKKRACELLRKVNRDRESAWGKQEKIQGSKFLRVSEWKSVKLWCAPNSVLFCSVILLHMLYNELRPSYPVPHLCPSMFSISLFVWSSETWGNHRIIKWPWFCLPPAPVCWVAGKALNF